MVSSDKCALSLGMSRDSISKRRGSSVVDDMNSDIFSEAESDFRDTDVSSVIADNEVDINKLEAAMELMGPEGI